MADILTITYAEWRAARLENAQDCTLIHRLECDKRAHTRYASCNANAATGETLAMDAWVMAHS